MATSGVVLATSSSSSSPSPAWPTTSKPASTQQPRQALPQDQRVVGQHYPHGSSARMRVPRTGRR